MDKTAKFRALHGTQSLRKFTNKDVLSGAKESTITLSPIQGMRDLPANPHCKQEISQSTPPPGGTSLLTILVKLPHPRVSPSPQTSKIFLTDVNILYIKFQIKKSYFKKKKAPTFIGTSFKLFALEKNYFLAAFLAQAFLQAALGAAAFTALRGSPA